MFIKVPLDSCYTTRAAKPYLTKLSSNTKQDQDTNAPSIIMLIKVPLDSCYTTRGRKTVSYYTIVYFNLVSLLNRPPLYESISKTVCSLISLRAHFIPPPPFHCPHLFLNQTLFSLFISFSYVTLASGLLFLNQILTNL